MAGARLALLLLPVVLTGCVVTVSPGPPLVVGHYRVRAVAVPGNCVELRTRPRIYEYGNVTVYRAPRRKYVCAWGPPAGWD